MATKKINSSLFSARNNCKLNFQWNSSSRKIKAIFLSRKLFVPFRMITLTACQNGENSKGNKERLPEQKRNKTCKFEAMRRLR